MRAMGIDKGREQLGKLPLLLHRALGIGTQFQAGGGGEKRSG